MSNTIQTLFSASGITDSTRMIHTPGEFAKKNLLYVQEVGRLKSLAFINRPARIWIHFC